MLQEIMKRIAEIEKRMNELGSSINSEKEALKLKELEQEKLDRELKVLISTKKQLEEL